MRCEVAQPVGQADLRRRGMIDELHQHWRAPFEAAYLERWACWRRGEGQTNRSAEAVCEGECKAGVQSAALTSLAASAPGEGSARGRISEWRCKQGKGCTCERRPAEAGEVCERFRASAQASSPSCGGQRTGGVMRAGRAAEESKSWSVWAVAGSRGGAQNPKRASGSPGQGKARGPPAGPTRLQGLPVESSRG